MEKSFDIYKKIKFFIKRYFLLKKLTFHFCVHLVEHCNLNCQMCNAFAPIAEPNYYDINKYEADCKALSKIFKNRTHKVLLMGGEPLLHPDISKFMNITRKYFPYEKTTIVIITNGILLLNMPESFWDNCQKYNIEIVLTKYPINLNYKEIENKITEHNIKYSYHKGYIQEIERKSFKHNLDETGKQNINNAYRCPIGSVTVLKYGKLYKCPICANINNFNKFFNKSLDVSDKDYLDVSKKHTENEIFMFMYKPSPFCRYCIISEKAAYDVIDWNYSKRDIKEWT